MRNMTLLMLALAALLGAAHGQVKDAPAAAGPLWDGPCPATWPAGLKGTGVALTLKFAADSDADCAAPGFASAAASVSSKSAAALTAVGALAAVETRVLDPSGIKFLPTNVAGCKSQGGVGVAQTIVDATKTWLEFPDARWQRQLAADLHLADACPSNPASYERKSLGKVWTAFCSEMAAGRRLASATACVQNAPSDITYVPGRAAAACFPGDAALMRADSATGAALGPARMDELAIGDAVQCLVPSGVPGGRRETGLYRDDQQAYAPGVCHVFGYLDADKDRRVSFVALHYTDAAGRPAKLRASPEHLVYVAAASMAAASASAAAAAPLKELPPGGAARRADAVSVGDLLAVQSEGGAYRLAAVKEITREVHQGAYAPLLTNAGLPLVDGAAAFSWVHLLPDSAPHPMQNIGEYMRQRSLDASSANLFV
ncbi:hypothetical protein MNEG_13851 [Monoraphidium neglectum]|uniref:Hedgehog protein Hint domain-containing protein n=1 Tax=Monoraphidium neglectum TaxID=145388 RepID=A0A0D2MGB1_9CHLO|nr:hypothetical protein MNEG_13851 [Monoraphidium neglectum]KIY94110.1 hypothetical protein MNEG_13851 [Monoraphidium neglectum]|eukprot:XP_013893130.1 hypothetical protein MNEG_13851 [Monoraphidium neglectum]